MTGSRTDLDVVIIGAGPTAASLLERLSANAAELLDDQTLRIHLVDPHRAGTGRVWRPDLDPLLWMNSLAQDVTMFTDASVRCEGPIRPGPSLLEWTATVGENELAEIAAAELMAEIRAVDAMTFPSRLVQAAYLEWFHRLVLVQLPPNLSVWTHGQRAVDLCDLPDGRQRVTLADGGIIEADTVVLCLGHLDAEPDVDGAAHTAFAARHGLTYVPPGHTGDQDLSGLQAGSDVLVSGFGQAFTDLMILLTAGRGGRFVDKPDGTLRYRPSGQEPILHVGSRRGVPYRSKLDYRLQAPLAPLPHFLDEAAIVGLLARPEPLEFRRDLFPLVAKEVGWAYYHELFVAHPTRTTTTWETFAPRYEPLRWGAEVDALVAETVPDPADRFDFNALDRPLRSVRSERARPVHEHIAAHIAADVARRTDPTFSADLGAFMALLTSFGALARLAASGRVTDRSRIEDISGSWFSFFMYYASGPPPARLHQYLALAEAGLLHFVGAEMTVEADEERGRFVACSSSHPESTVASALVDARIAPASVSRSADALLQALHRSGDVVEEVVEEVVEDLAGSGPGGETWRANTGKVVVAGGDVKVMRADGSAHPRRHALGAFTSRPASGVLSRPGSNAATFRQNDTVARAILRTLAAHETTGVVGPEAGAMAARSTDRGERSGSGGT